MKFLSKTSKNGLYFITLVLATISTISRAMSNEPKVTDTKQNLTKTIIDILDKKTVCWVCGKNISPKDLSSFSCGHSSYHNNCVSKIDPNASCPICLKLQK